MKKTKEIKIGNIKIGGCNDISIQSMTNTKTADKASTLAQIKALTAAGCDIVRFTVNDMAAAEAIPFYAENTNIPATVTITKNGSFNIQCLMSLCGRSKKALSIG